MKRLLLLGGGHAHVRVLRALAQRPLVDWEVVLLTPHDTMLYSGMLPGWVAGHYTLEQCAIQLAPLAAAAQVRLVVDEAQAMEADARHLDSRANGGLDWDLLSIDVGSACLQDGIEGAALHAVPARPIRGLVDSWSRLLVRVGTTGQAADLVVVGAGPGGIELAFGAQHRAAAQGWSGLNVHLVSASAMPAPSSPPRVQARLAELMAQRGIRWHGGRTVTAVTRDTAVLDSGEVLRADACWLVTGPAAHGWLARSGLATDAAGFVRVGPTLQSLSHPNVFVAGDAASHPGPVPKSGVYAVRSGAVLATNLLATCRGEPMVDWQPPSRALYLLSTADCRATALWGPWSLEGKWLWTLKDRIDRGFIERHSA